MELLSRENISAAREFAAENPWLGGAAVSGAVAVAFVVKVLRRWLRLRHIRGPPLAGFTNLWLVRAVMGGNTHWDLGFVNEKYGKLIPTTTDIFLPTK